MKKKVVIVLFGLPTGASRRNELANKISSILFEATHRTTLVSTENVRSMIWKPTYRSEDEEEAVYKSIKLVSLAFVESGYNVVISGVFGTKKWYDHLLKSIRENAEEVLPIYVVREDMKKAVDSYLTNKKKRVPSSDLRHVEDYFKELTKRFDNYDFALRLNMDTLNVQDACKLVINKIIV